MTSGTHGLSRLHHTRSLDLRKPYTPNRVTSFLPRFSNTLPHSFQ
ncbi:hypothetical protein RchiOBHm_Chr2g0106951 [Rosa chinensis]|uniref:Uncharacterized protein n=1 Tax=Rosa chinensis TaxID=74649 RepID=A0A2P6RNX4_ROSCH|nr:hypothetical protein RchiOBHm_Chr2g0106951 [Rosa chinensis]